MTIVQVFCIQFSSILRSSPEQYVCQFVPFSGQSQRSSMEQGNCLLIRLLRIADHFFYVNNTPCPLRGASVQRVLQTNAVPPVSQRQRNSLRNVFRVQLVSLRSKFLRRFHTAPRFHRGGHRSAVGAVVIFDESVTCDSFSFNVYLYSLLLTWRVRLLSQMPPHSSCCLPSPADPLCRTTGSAVMYGSEEGGRGRVSTSLRATNPQDTTEYAYGLS